MGPAGPCFRPAQLKTLPASFLFQRSLYAAACGRHQRFVATRATATGTIAFFRARLQFHSSSLLRQAQAPRSSSAPEDVPVVITREEALRRLACRRLHCLKAISVF